MIIECPACSSRYRIREDKLPEAGGNIKCPNCAHIFFVPRDGAVGSASLSGEHPMVATAEAAGPRIAESEAVAAPADTAAKRWKLKNAVGLVYDFPSTEQLRTWLASRESHEGFEVSSDAGARWSPITEITDLADVKPTGRKAVGPQTLSFRASGVQRAVTSAGAAPAHGNSGSFPASAEKMREDAQARLQAAKKKRQVDTADTSAAHEYQHIKPPPTRQQQQATRVLGIMALFILPLLGFILLQASGVIDMADLGFGSRRQPIPEYVPPPPRAETRPGNRLDLTPEQAVTRLMTLAAAAQSRNEPELAIEHLEQATEVMPEDKELRCLLVPLYTALNREADAARAQERCTATEDALDGDPEAAAQGAAGEGAPEGSGAPADQPPGDAPVTP